MTDLLGRAAPWDGGLCFRLSALRLLTIRIFQILNIYKAEAFASRNRKRDRRDARDSRDMKKVADTEFFSPVESLLSLQSLASLFFSSRHAADVSSRS
jgi:hypothetical protein